MKLGLNLFVIYGFILILTACSSSRPQIATPTSPTSTSTRTTTPSPTSLTHTPDIGQIHATQTQSLASTRTEIAQNGRNFRSTLAAQSTIVALTPSPTATITLSPTPTMDYSPYLDSWSVFLNEEYGFSFEYRTLWDLPPFNWCFQIDDREDTLTVFHMYFGAHSEFAVIPANGLYRVAFVDQWIQNRTESSQWELLQRENQIINGLGVTFIHYQFGGGRYGESYFFYNNDTIYIFNLNGGAFCDFPEFGLYETGLYWEALNSFQFITPSP